MEFSKKIPDKIFEKLSEKRWHRHGIYRNNVLQASFISCYHGKKWYRREGIEIDFSNLLQLNDENYVDEDEFDELVSYFERKINNPFLDEYIKRYRKDNKKILQTSREIGGLNHSFLSDDELGRNIEKFFKQSRELIHWLWSMEFLNPALDKVIRKKIEVENIDVEETLYLLSFLEKKLAFQKEREEIAELSKLTKNDILKLYRKYDWMNMYFWDGSPMNIEEYEKRAKKIFSDKGYIKEKTKDNKENIKKFRRIRENIKDKKLLKLIDIAQELIFLKTERIDVFTVSWRNVWPLVEEILKRRNVSIRELYNMTEMEIIDFAGGKDMPKDVNKRSDGAIIRLNNQVYFYYGNAYRKVSEWLKKKNKRRKSIINGKVAFPGKAKGIVKILMSDRDLHKIRSGNILVANLTNPNYDPVFPKIRAIITDEGGLLCHSAIMAREFKIPCIIGTKIATQVLKDGDLVEVDAEKGVVKILERK